MAYLLNSVVMSHMTSLILTGGAIVATIGAFRIYYKWQQGGGNIENDIALWVLGIVFLFAGITAAKLLF